MEYTRLATASDALAVVDGVQRGVRGQFVLAMPRIPWVRVVLFPTFLLLVGSEAARAQRSDGLNDALVVVYAVLAAAGLVAERLADQRRGLSTARRRFPRAGKRQMLGVWVVIGAIVATNVLGARTDAWWIGLPIGLLAAAATLWGRARWVASFDRLRDLGGSTASYLPGGVPTGPFSEPGALRLGALLALVDRARPQQLEAALELPAGALTAAAGELARGGHVRILEPSTEGEILAFTGKGRRAFRGYLTELTDARTR